MCEITNTKQKLTVSLEKPKIGSTIDLWDLGQRSKPESTKKWVRTSHGRLVSTGMILICLLLKSSPAKAEITQSQAIRAIVGEAENQGLKGMTAVAEALRNRGTIKGVYGVNSPRLKKAPKWVFVMASKAWKDSEKSNLVKGATHWENIKEFGVPYWAPSMKKTATIKDHAFYVEVRS